MVIFATFVLMGNERVESIDVFRGITMAMMVMVNNPGSWKAVYPPLVHAEWNGLTPTDCIFPWFLFIMGVSMFYSLRKGGFTLSWKILKRALALFGIGLVFNFIGKGIGGNWSLEDLRYLGVLQRFGLCFGFTALLVCTVPHKWLGWIAAGILAAYSAILLLGNGYVQGADSILAQVDKAVLGEGHIYKWGNGIDPEGVLSTLPAIAHTVIGFLVGTTLASKDMRKLDGAGILMLLGGFILMWALPINKKIWSPSFVLVTCGLGALILSLLHWLIDETHTLRHVAFWKTFGSNAIYCYIMAVILGWILRLTDGRVLIMNTLGINENTSLLFALCIVTLVWLLALPLYKRRIFIKL